MIGVIDIFKDSFDQGILQDGDFGIIKYLDSDMAYDIESKEFCFIYVNGKLVLDNGAWCQFDNDEDFEIVFVCRGVDCFTNARYFHKYIYLGGYENSNYDDVQVVYSSTNPVIEMTLSDIEKKLGYKIKLVSKNK